MADALHTPIFQSLAGPDVPSGATNITVDANNDGLAFAFQPHSADPITHLGFRYGARTGTPPTYVVTLEGLDASTGLPDETDVGGGSPTAVTFTPPADTTINGLWQWKTLTNAYTPTRGQILCMTIRYSSGTVDGSNNSSFTNQYSAAFGNTAAGFPYPITLAAGTWTKVATAPYPCFGYRTASGRYGCINQSHGTTTTANTAGHCAGMFFTIPSGWGSTFQVNGLEFIGKPAASGGSFKIAIYNTSGVLQQSCTIDGDNVATPGDTNDRYLLYFSDTNLPNLSCGTKYYAVLEVISGTVNVNHYTVAEAADASTRGGGVQYGLVTYSGSWVETATTIPIMNLVLDDLTTSSGGGRQGLHAIEAGAV